MTDWITDRAPTENDADPDGDVAVRRQPYREGKKVYRDWSLIAAGTPWRHTEYWTERDTPEPVTTRRFASITRTVTANGSHTIDAIDTDGNAWWMVVGDPDWDQGWQRMTPLPTDA